MPRITSTPIANSSIAHSNGHGKLEFELPIEDRIQRLGKLFSLMQPVPKEWYLPKDPIQRLSNGTPILGEDAYYGIMGEFVQEVAPYTEATDMGILAHLLLAIGTYLGPNPHIHRGAPQPPRLNAVLVGTTSHGAKGTSAYPVRSLMKSINNDFIDNQWETGLSSGEGLVVKVADTFEIDEETKEKIPIPVEKRVFVIEEEFSSVLVQTAKEGNILSQVVRCAFDNGNLGTMTVIPRKALGAHICIMGHITPEELKYRFKTIEMVNGLGNRFLWFYVKSDKELPHTKGVPLTVIDKFAKRFNSLFEFARRILNVDMTNGAAALWTEEYHLLKEDRPYYTGAMLGRGRVIILRIALIYCLMDHKSQIDVAHLRAALAVWKYSEESVMSLFGKRDKAADPEAEPISESLADRILKMLGEGQMKRTEIYNKVRNFTKAPELETCLAKLEADGLVTSKSISPGKGGGKSAKAYQLVGEVSN